MTEALRTTRLLELATMMVRIRHEHNAGSGHLVDRGVDDCGFSTCPHSDCVLVREAALAAVAGGGRQEPHGPHIMNSIEMLLSDALLADSETEHDQRENWRLSHIASLAVYLGVDLQNARAGKIPPFRAAAEGRDTPPPEEDRDSGRRGSSSPHVVRTTTEQKEPAGTPRQGVTAGETAALTDAELLAMWRSAQGPRAALNGPLIRFAGLVAAAVRRDTPPPKLCRICNGSGEDADTDGAGSWTRVPCATCDGTGVEPMSELTLQQKQHTIVAEIRRCLDTDKMLRAYEKLDALDDLIRRVSAGGDTPQEPPRPDPQRMQDQAIAISLMLADAGIPAMTLPEGVRMLIEQRDSAREARAVPPIDCRICRMQGLPIGAHWAWHAFCQSELNPVAFVEWLQRMPDIEEVQRIIGYVVTVTGMDWNAAAEALRADPALPQDQPAAERET